MMAQSKREFNAGTPNSPNPAKFLKEMQALIPRLHSSGILPPNRGEARSHGRKNVLDFLEKETMRLGDQEKFRAYKVNQWFDKNMSEVAPRAIALVQKLGPRFGWLLRVMGYRLKALDATEQGVPFTVCTITRFGRLKVGLRMFWEDPKKGNIIHERR